MKEVEKNQRVEDSNANVPVIEIKELHKSFGSNQVLKGVNLTVNKGENLVVLGKSGSGKSITIKCIVKKIKAKWRLFMIVSKTKKYWIKYLLNTIS